MNRAAHILLGVGSPLMLVALLAGGAWAESVFVVLAVLFPAALCALGAGRRGRWFVGALGLVLLATASVLVAPTGGPGVTGLGLARGLVVLIAGFALVPLSITGFGHAADRGAGGDAGDERTSGDAAPGGR